MNSVLLLSMPGTMEWIFIFAIGFLIPVICIVDIMSNNFRGVYTKWIWCTLVVFFPLIGSLLYWWIGREQRVMS